MTKNNISISISPSKNKKFLNDVTNYKVVANSKGD